jgi:nucleotide-binding universal stress UspA family protein
MKRILCVIDLAESSGKVLEVAAMIANACTAHLIVLYPYRLIHQGHRGDMTSLKIQLEKDAREKFMLLSKSVCGMEGLSWEFHPEIGFIADRINAHVKRGAVDMVILGQEQTAITNDIRSFSLQDMISGSNLPFVIVPSEVKAEASV